MMQRKTILRLTLVSTPASFMNNTNPTLHAPEIFKSKKKKKRAARKIKQNVSEIPVYGRF
jgi:hypothetical protein